MRFWVQVFILFYCSRDSSGIIASHHVYVCDIDKPWDTFLVTCLVDPIVSLEWHSSGFKLLIATVHGLVEVWKMEVCHCYLIK